MNKMKLTAILLFILVFIFDCKSKGKLFYQKDISFKSLTGAEDFSFKHTRAETEILMINFFADNCPPCLAEVPEIKAFLEEGIEKDENLKTKVEFIGIGSALGAIGDDVKLSIDEIKKSVTNFVQKIKLTMPIYYATGEQLIAFGVTGYPETFVFFRDNNRNWYLKRKFISSITKSDLANYLEYEGLSIYSK